MRDISDLIGRILISVIFYFEAYDSAENLSSTKVTMSSYGLNDSQNLLLYGGITVLVLGATMVLLGYRSKTGAFLLMTYWIPVTFIVYSFWNETGQALREQSIHFMKNIAIIGGLLIVLVNGSGKYSVRRLFATTKVKNSHKFFL